MLSNAFYSNCFQLSVQVVRCCSHLARSCVVFHRWVGKTCDTLIDQSRHARPELGDTIGVVMSIRVKKSIRSQDIRSELGIQLESCIQPESCLPTWVGHTTKITCTTGVTSSDRSHVFRPESGLPTGVGHKSGVVHMTSRVGVICPAYRGPPIKAKNSGYDWFPPAVNDWRTIHPVPGNKPTTPGWRGGHQHKKNWSQEWSTPPLLLPVISVDRRDFITYLPLPPLSPTRGINPGPWTSMPRGYPQRISIAHSEPWKVAPLGAWHEGT
jgi:hypothetical protein